MSFSSPRLWLAILSASGVLLFVAGSLGRTAPGELTTVHRRVAELRGRAGCADCHGGWGSSMTDSCLDCHEAIAAQMERGDGLHGSLDAGLAPRCARCHSEHHGPGFAIVNTQSFAAAGIRDVEAFDHALVGFAMAGRHLETDCAECHEHARDAVLPEGAFRFLGLDQRCGTCHEDPHEGRLTSDCARCHDQEAFDGHRFDGHEEHLALVGGHAGLDCRACHAEGDAHALEALAPGGSGPPARACEDCHESPHAGAFVDGVAALVALEPRASCAACHRDEHEGFREEEIEVDAERHAASGFPLEPPHAGVACAECHDPAAPDFHARFPGRGADDCAACHDDPHEGQFRASPFAARGCLGCHERLAFEPHAFTTAKHAQAAFALTGAHATTDCGACHLAPIVGGEGGGARVFRGTPRRCESCHEDAHRGFFDGLPPAVVAAREGECARCHRTTSFSEVDLERFDHGEATGFATRGAHAQTSCETCHPPSEHPDSAGRTFGWASERFGELRGCATCHTDPHAGAFDGAGMPAEVQGREACSRCHVQSSFRSFPHGFDHGLWTGYALDGRHAEAGCSSCHARLREPDAAGRTWGRARGTACADCHADPHAGQFRYRGATSCERCHESAASFRELVFDHDRDSRFPLEGAHRTLDCGACHEPWDAGGGTAIVRYRPLGTRCVDCHGVGEEEMRERAEGRR